MFIFSFLESIDKYYERASSVNVAEGDLTVAEFFFLVAVGHHQVVAKAVGQATTRSLSNPAPGGQKFVTGRLN